MITVLIYSECVCVYVCARMHVCVCVRVCQKQVPRTEARVLRAKFEEVHTGVASA
jgi:hypothetical protein